MSGQRTTKGIADRAFAHSGRADLTVYNNDPGAEDQSAGMLRQVSADDLDALDAALTICRALGEAEFLELSGDFDIVIAEPPGERLRRSRELGSDGHVA